MSPAQAHSVRHWTGHSVALFCVALRWLHYAGNGHISWDDVASNIETAELAADLAMIAARPT